METPAPRYTRPRRRTLAQVLGLPSVKSQKPLVLALIVDAIGNGVSGPLMLLFLVRVAHLSLVSAGAMLSAGSLVGLAVPAAVGWIVHRVGARRVVIAAQVIQAVGFIGYLVSRDVWLLMACILLTRCGGRAFWSSVFGVIADAADRGATADHDKWFAMSGMVQSAGIAAGGLLAGALLVLHGSSPYYIALGLNAASFVVSAALLVYGSRPTDDPSAAAQATQRQRKPPATQILHDPTYLALIGVNTLFIFRSVLLGIGLPIYILHGLHQPGWIVGPTLAIVTIIGATCQSVAVRALRGRRPTRILAAAGILWTMWGLLTAAIGQLHGPIVLPALVGTVLVFATAELIHAPTSMGLASTCAPPVARASYLSYFQYSFSIAATLCPLGFGVLETRRPALPWIVIAAVAATATAGILVLEHRLTARNPDVNNRRPGPIAEPE